MFKGVGSVVVGVLAKIWLNSAFGKVTNGFILEDFLKNWRNIN